MADLLPGYAPELALHRLLELRGRTCTRQELKEQLGDSPDLEALLRLLQRHGLEARPVRIRVADLAHLELPTLVRQGEEAWLVLRNVAPDGYLVEGAGGSRTMNPQELGEMVARVARRLLVAHVRAHCPRGWPVERHDAAIEADA